MSSSLEAKIVVLGSQGVGKTSLVMRYCKGAFTPSQITSTVGASFLTKRVVDTDTDTVVRLQIWDTARAASGSSGFWGQEVGWDACHEISAESGEGVEEVFRVVTRKLVEQNRKMQAAALAATGAMAGNGDGFHGGGGGGGEYGSGWGGEDGYGSGGGGGGGGYFDGNPRAGFRVGRDRRSWLFSPGFSPVIGGTAEEEAEWARNGDPRGRGRRGCC
ncbi:hypothetical protein CHGG_04768 [Chaetomium globosum CBS 148.51]|uniref:Uncharacterized protein n=1 Tax=Chaetomium globosum (strain ATCC 6205 / CBS 148.51 / DSM 1962 / NBRC 6347 / NRRL 1970) TaxID=306901 RepID=Q2H0C8_CHAGB|nr:uncharacterized protein CHGG_04768 [Chaetomium globosum CBS 148.51]EAQ88149.1 hypothetical protein CHGG_04768 [Chaetomium globosum CBS 148.51]